MTPSTLRFEYFTYGHGYSTIVHQSRYALGILPRIDTNHTPLYDRKVVHLLGLWRLRFLNFNGMIHLE